MLLCFMGGGEVRSETQILPHEEGATLFPVITVSCFQLQGQSSVLPAGLSLATEGPALETWSLPLFISKILCVRSHSNYLNACVW